LDVGELNRGLYYYYHCGGGGGGCGGGCGEEWEDGGWDEGVVLAGTVTYYRCKDYLT
jgi:hypothetical protein